MFIKRECNSNSVGTSMISLEVSSMPINKVAVHVLIVKTNTDNRID
jgi:hypothetical protein